jgi:ketosteroid isomerase-like protein
MGERENRAAVERYWDALSRQDFDAAMKDLHEDFVEEYVQSGERIRGIANQLAVISSYPGFPAITVRHHIGRDDLWVTHAAFDYARDGGPPYQVCQVQELRDGKIARIHAFFGAPFEPAEWRAAWVERVS